MKLAVPVPRLRIISELIAGASIADGLSDSGAKILAAGGPSARQAREFLKSCPALHAVASSDVIGTVEHDRLYRINRSFVPVEDLRQLPQLGCEVDIVSGVRATRAQNQGHSVGNPNHVLSPREHGKLQGNRVQCVQCHLNANVNIFCDIDRFDAQDFTQCAVEQRLDSPRPRNAALFVGFSLGAGQAMYRERPAIQGQKIQVQTIGRFKRLQIVNHLVRGNTASRKSFIH